MNTTNNFKFNLVLGTFAGVLLLQYFFLALKHSISEISLGVVIFGEALLMTCLFPFIGRLIAGEEHYQEETQRLLPPETVIEEEGEDDLCFKPIEIITVNMHPQP